MPGTEAGLGTFGFLMSGFDAGGFGTDWLTGFVTAFGWDFGAGFGEGFGEVFGGGLGEGFGEGFGGGLGDWLAPTTAAFFDLFLNTAKTPYPPAEARIPAARAALLAFKERTTLIRAADGDRVARPLPKFGFGNSAVSCQTISFLVMEYTVATIDIRGVDIILGSNEQTSPSKGAFPEIRPSHNL